MTGPGFFESLEERAAESLLCVGLDPRNLSSRAARDRCVAIITATADHAAAFKPNAAFFEALGADGFGVLAEVIAAVPEEIPVLLDAKRGDISSTAEAYARAAFEHLGAGAVTLHPYLGRESVAPFLEFAGRGVFVLCRTSNPGGADLQESEMQSGEPVYVRVARSAAGWADRSRLGLVVGATAPVALQKVRRVAPEHWILAPGVGAQGGSAAAAVGAGIRADGSGLLLAVSRAIFEAPDPASVAAELHAAIERTRSFGTSVAEPGVGDELAELLFDAGCIRLGDFELKSGRRSPIYLDLRNLVGHPALLTRVAARYVPLLGEADRMAGVPLAGLPIATAVSLAAGVPMVFPRPEVKDHGTGEEVEGPFEAGESVVIVDDVATGGSSILLAADRLRGAGLDVDTAVVLVDRGAGAAAALAEKGIALRAVTSLDGVVAGLLRSGRLGTAEAGRVESFLQGE